MLAKLISIKFFVSQDKYNEFVDKFTKLIDDFIEESNISREELLSEMHLPSNYKDLKWT